MQKKIPLILLVFGLGAILYGVLKGCGDPVKKNLIAYLNEDLAPVREAEIEAVRQYNEFWALYADNRPGYRDRLSNDVIPAYEAFLAALESVATSSPQGDELYEKYLDAVRTQVEGLRKLQAALIAKDRRGRAQAEGVITSGRNKVRAYRDELLRLAREHDVRIE